MASTHKVLFDFAAKGEGTLAVSKGELCTVLKKMDDTGWCTVRTAKGGMGLVPSTYLQPLMGKVVQGKQNEMGVLDVSLTLSPV